MTNQSFDTHFCSHEKVTADTLMDNSPEIDSPTESITKEVLYLLAENDRLLRALCYLADCHAATAECEGRLSKTSKRSQRRFASICSTAVKMLEGADLPGTRWGREGSPQVFIDRCRHAAEDLSE